MVGRAPLVPLRHFFDDPARTAEKLSPDGARIAYRAPEGGRLNVWVRTVGVEDDRPITHDHRRGIPDFRWTRDGGRILYVQDRDGDENYHVFLLDVIDPDASPRDLTPFDGVRAEILSLPRHAPDRAVIAMNREDPDRFQPYAVDLRTGELIRLAENPGDVWRWLVDPQGAVRGAIVPASDGGWMIRMREPDGGHRTLAHVAADEQPDFLLGFTPDGEGLLVGLARDGDFGRLVRIDCATGEETILDHDPNADLDGIVTGEQDGAVLGAVYVHERRIVHPLDDRFARDWERLRALRAGDPRILGMDANETTLLVAYDDDRDPGTTYLYDRAGGTATMLWRARPWLEPHVLAPMQPISFTARDGLTIHGYLTLPLGGERSGRLPTVLLVHGGPWARDRWGYHPEAQFLANRGYAVMQINFRGSSGYGKAFMEAGAREWAGAMHHDLMDGLRWAVERGYADPSRVGIVGTSYGGYAALVGASFTPQAFACAVSICGPSNLVTLLESFPRYHRTFVSVTFHRHIGDPDDSRDRADMEARSPLFKADRITAPLLIAQGANDPRVTKRESDQIVDALRARGVHVRYLCKNDEGHGFSNPENKLELYAATERFLAEHLGGRAENTDAT